MKNSSKEKKVAEVLHQFKENQLHSGKSKTLVTNRKQAIAISLSEAEELYNKNNKL